MASAACASSRIFGISFPASTLSGALSNVRFRIALPSTILIFGIGWPGIGIPSSIGITSLTPGALLTAAVTAPILSAETTIWVGSPSPPGKCLSNNFCPTTDSGLPVNVSTVPMPSAFKVVEANARANKNNEEITQARRGCLPIPLPTFDHVPDIT